MSTRGKGGSDCNHTGESRGADNESSSGCPLHGTTELVRTHQGVNYLCTLLCVHTEGRMKGREAKEMFRADGYIHYLNCRMDSWT